MSRFCSMNFHCRPMFPLSRYSFRSSSLTGVTLRNGVALSTHNGSEVWSNIQAPRYCMPLSTACCSRNASTEERSTFSSTILKWILAAGLGTGIYMWCGEKPKLSLCQANCKEADGSSMRARYNFVADAVEKASHAVVHINASKSVRTVFGEFQTVGVGSGFVVENGEYVLTNAHVVSGATNLDIKLSSGQIVQGEVTDLDEEVDLALVKLNLPSNVSITPATFGDSTSIRPGEWVVAMGSPFTLSNTITCGVVSSVDRPSKDLGLNKGDLEYIQTDAAITIGNSGGPLVNLDGEVIGINVMTAHPGFSFAIPIKWAEVFLRHARRNPLRHTNSHYVIGTTLAMLSPRVMGVLRHYYSIPYERGIRISSVAKGGPAENAGLIRGDIVVKVNDQNVTSTKDLTAVISKGKRFSVEFYRKNEHMKCYIQPMPV